MKIFSSAIELLEAGGGVLWLILLVSICLWSLIFERLIFFKMVYPKSQHVWLKQWQLLTKHCEAKEVFYIKSYLISEARITMEKSLAIIKMLITICPMLGLLGTVVGMIDVFDAMAVTGNGNARSMASGISQATISTMAGMVIAILGLYFHQYLQKKIDTKTYQLYLLFRNDELIAPQI